MNTHTDSQFTDVKETESCGEPWSLTFWTSIQFKMKKKKMLKNIKHRLLSSRNKH